MRRCTLALRSAVTRSCLLIALASTIACDGLGRPIIGEVTTTRRIDCRLGELPECNYARAPREPIRAPTFDPFTMSTGRCTPPAETMVLASSDALPRELACASVEIRLAGRQAPSAWQSLQATQSVLKFVAEQPATLVLAAAKLESVRIELSGPVTLELVEASALHQVHVAGAGAGVATLRAQDMTASNLTIELPGFVSIAHCQLFDVRVITTQLSIDTSSFEQLSVRSDELFAAQIDGLTFVSEADHARIAASTIVGMFVQRCTSMAILSSMVREGLFLPCSQPLRVDQSSVVESEVLGQVESLGSDWFENAFGAGQATSVELWRSESFSGNVLCRDAEHFALVQTHSASCNACEQLGTRSAEVICGVDAQPRPLEPTLGNVDYGVFNPRCPELDTPAMCDPLPVDKSPAAPSHRSIRTR